MIGLQLFLPEASELEREEAGKEEEEKTEEGLKKKKWLKRELGKDEHQ